MSPRRPPKVCTIPGCPNLATEGKCPAHQAESRRASDQRRGSAASRGYGSQHRDRFRAGVLAREPQCAECRAPSTVADHWPLSRRELVARGFDPDDPLHGRGMCKRCHDRATATAQPGGWNR
jgi:5-methylcytosine-specific restriction enzyme A